MASFHFAVKSISRGKGHSAVAGSAYRLGLNLHDERTGLTHKYSKRSGVLHGQMHAPKNAPEWARDPAQLWNRVEAHETRKNARVAREFVIALPHELTLSQNIRLVEDLAQMVVDRYSTAVQTAIHAPDEKGDQRNTHLHLMFAPRVIDQNGFGAYTAKAFDDYKQGPVEILAMREHVANCINLHLMEARSDARVDHRRLEDQCMDAVERGEWAKARELDRLPTVKEGKKPERASRQRARNEQIAKSNEARQHEWDMLEAKAGQECRLMPAYREKKAGVSATATPPRPRRVFQPRAHGPAPKVTRSVSASAPARSEAERHVQQMVRNEEREREKHARALQEQKIHQEKLAKLDEEFLAIMQRTETTLAQAWVLRHQNVVAHQKWLDGFEARREEMTTKVKAVETQARQAMADYRAWVKEHPEPNRWARSERDVWQAEHDKIALPAREQADGARKVVSRLRSLEEEAEHRKRKRDQELQARRALKLMPSEEAQASQVDWDTFRFPARPEVPVSELPPPTLSPVPFPVLKPKGFDEPPEHR